MRFEDGGSPFAATTRSDKLFLVLAGARVGRREAGGALSSPPAAAALHLVNNTALPGVLETSEN